MGLGIGRQITASLHIVLPFLVEAAVKERYPLGLEAGNNPITVQGELHNPAPDMRLYFQLTHERCLVFGRSCLKHMDLPWKSIFRLVILSVISNYLECRTFSSPLLPLLVLQWIQSGWRLSMSLVPPFESGVMLSIVIFSDVPHHWHFPFSRRSFRSHASRSIFPARLFLNKYR